MDPAFFQPAAQSRDGLPIARPFMQARHLRVDLIDPNPDQPRHTLEGIEELAAHVKQYGLLQPIVVTRNGDGRFTLIAGHRRLAAVRWLAEHDDPDRWRHIPTITRTLETEERLTLALAENLARQALSDAEVATAIRVLVDLHGWNQTQIARRLGVSHQWINQDTRVLAEPDLAAHVQTGHLSVAKAYQIQRAQSPEARQAALDAALNGAPFSAVRRLAEGAPAPGESSPTAAATAAPDPTTLATPVSPIGAHPPDSTPNPADSGRTSPPPPFNSSETGQHTVPGASNLHPSPDPRFAAGLGNRVALRALAINTLLQEARRRRLSALPVSTLQEALLADLRALAAGPHLP